MLSEACTTQRSRDQRPRGRTDQWTRRLPRAADIGLSRHARGEKPPRDSEMEITKDGKRIKRRQLRIFLHPRTPPRGAVSTEHRPNSSVTGGIRKTEVDPFPPIHFQKPPPKLLVNVPRGLRGQTARQLMMGLRRDACRACAPPRRVAGCAAARRPYSFHSWRSPSRGLRCLRRMPRRRPHARSCVESTFT
jgi:hypothetical protein